VSRLIRRYRLRAVPRGSGKTQIGLRNAARQAHWSRSSTGYQLVQVQLLLLRLAVGAG